MNNDSNSIAKLFKKLIFSYITLVFPKNTNVRVWPRKFVDFHNCEGSSHDAFVDIQMIFMQNIYRLRRKSGFLDEDAIKRALEANFPSGSEDERLNMSDDSDMDPDYVVEKSNNDISSSESEPEVQLDEEENPMPGPSNITPGGDEPPPTP